MPMPGNRVLLSLAPFVVLVAVACIEVGHDAETGCLVDSTAPGCRTMGRGGNASGGSHAGGTAGAGARGGSPATGGAATGGTTATGGLGGAGGESAGGEGGA